jgi:hypothetical protein
MTSQIKRAYRGSNADMLTVCSTLMENAEAHKNPLIAKRKNWADPFFPTVRARIDSAFPNILGVDSAKNLREKTAQVNTIMKNANSDLSLFKVQLETDFRGNKARLKEIMTQLGIAQHNTAAKKGNQGEMLALLYKFKTNMTPELQSEISEAGTDSELITSIIGYADAFSASNVSQESLKGGRKELTMENLTELNAIYNQVIGIARIARSIFKDSYPIRDQFSYNKLLKAIGHQAAASSNEATSTPAEGTAVDLQPV